MPLRQVVIDQRPEIRLDGLAFVLLRGDSIGEIRGLERLQTLIDARKAVLESKLKLSPDIVGKQIDAALADQPTD